MLNCLSSFRGRTVVPLKQFRGSWGIWHPQLQSRRSGCFIWDHFSTGCTPKSWDGHDTAVHFGWTSHRSVAAPSAHGRTLLSMGRVPLEQVFCYVIVTTDASSMSWGATCNKQAASGLWTGPRLLWHINCIELLAVHLALRQFRTTAVRQVCIGPYGKHCGCLVHQPVERSAITPHVTAHPPSPSLE